MSATTSNASRTVVIVPANNIGVPGRPIMPERFSGQTVAQATPIISGGLSSVTKPGTPQLAEITPIEAQRRFSI